MNVNEFFDYVFFFWVTEYLTKEEKEIKPSIILCVLSFIVLYVPILFVVSMLSSFFKIKDLTKIFEIFTIIYIILFFINFILIIIYKIRKIIK